MPAEILAQDIAAQLQTQIRESLAKGQALQIVGNNSKHFYGNKPLGEPLEVAGHSGVIDYDPAELVITLRAGCKLVDVEALLAEHQQMLGFEPPQFNQQATIGGTVASGLAGPRRSYAGGLRDYLLGVKLIDGRGEILNFGGRVIKNVAGFDLSRLMAGAMGTLGVLLEVSLRVIPQFESELSLAFEHSAVEQHIRWINELGRQPLPLSASVWHDGQSTIRLSGSEQGVASAAAKLGGEVQTDNWLALREQSHDFFHTQSQVARISLPPTTEFRLQQNQLIEWAGAQRWLVGEIDVESLRHRLQQVGGHLCLFKGTADSASAFHPLDDNILALHRSLKSKFDPAGILNPERFYLGL